MVEQVNACVVGSTHWASHGSVTAVVSLRNTWVGSTSYPASARLASVPSVCETGRPVRKYTSYPLASAAFSRPTMPGTAGKTLAEPALTKNALVPGLNEKLL